MKRMNSPEEDHCILARGESDNYRNMVMDLDAEDQSFEHFKYYSRDVTQHETEECN